MRSLKNITNYADLQSTGQAYYDLNEDIDTKAIFTKVAHYSTNGDFIGIEEDSGWFFDIDGDRKLRFKIGRKSNRKNINPIPPNIHGNQFKMNLKLEISFRKKTWLGWANYSSETKTNMTFVIGNQTYRYSFNDKGASSHDWICPDELAWWFTGNYQNGRSIFFTPAINTSFETEFRAFDGYPVIKWGCTLPDVTFVEN